jgi:hypothetical protein
VEGTQGKVDTKTHVSREGARVLDPASGVPLAAGARVSEVGLLGPVLMDWDFCKARSRSWGHRQKWSPEEASRRRKSLSTNLSLRP